MTIDDDLLAAARALAERNSISLGDALSELARRGFRTGAATGKSDPGRGRVAFAVDPEARPITGADVRLSLNDWP